MGVWSNVRHVHDKRQNPSPSETHLLILWFTRGLLVSFRELDQNQHGWRPPVTARFSSLSSSTSSTERMEPPRRMSFPRKSVGFVHHKYGEDSYPIILQEHLGAASLLFSCLSRFKSPEWPLQTLPSVQWLDQWTSRELQTCGLLEVIVLWLWEWTKHIYMYGSGFPNFKSQ